MSTPSQTSSSTQTPAGCNQPRPERLPEPTIAPAALALGATFLLWGLVTSIIILLVGAALLSAGTAAWIREIRHERKQHS